MPPALYDQLRRMARSLLRNQRQGHTLQATALVNEAYLKVSGDAGPVFLDRSHFLAVMSRVMRHVLVDYARAHNPPQNVAASNPFLFTITTPLRSKILPHKPGCSTSTSPWIVSAPRMPHSPAWWKCTTSVG
ncbi:MAG: ECF-type sigma factor [Bryobacterales bacterium]|nr:ECF-type sigma factor [Bryobacterales bacterium]